MTKILKTSAIAGIVMLATLAVVSAYTFYLDENVMLQGTTFHIDGSQFKHSGYGVQVNFDGTWYRICSSSYTHTIQTITMLEDVNCDPYAAGGPICSGGSCGG